MTAAEFVTWPQARIQLALELERVRAGWEPPPDLTVSQWAEKNRFLPKGASSRPGPWRTESYQREIQDAFNDPAVHEIVFMKSTQVGASEILNNIAGYIIDADPQPFMFVLPTVDVAKNYSKKRIAKMINTCAALKTKVRPPRTKQGGNTILLKEFPGGELKLVGANSGAGLRSDPLPIVLFDEVEGYPDDVEGEGDPIEIARRRTDAYAGYKVMLVSTPGKPKRFSRIEQEFEKSDQRRFFVPCPFCAHRQPLRWRDPVTGIHRLIFERDEAGEVIRGTARYLCEACGAGISERQKQAMLDAGEWVAAFPDRLVRGYHLNALYSPWKDNWDALAKEWVEAQDNPERLRTFVNLRLGETWEESGDAIEAHALEKRKETYPAVPGDAQARIPPGVGALTLQVDTQANRLEAKVIGWGAGEESWLIDYARFDGDPGAGDASIEGSVWHQLEQYRLREFPHPSGKKARPAITVIDSGGHHTDAVYDFVAPRQNPRDRVYALKGVEFHAKLGLVQEGTTRRSAIRLFTVATAAAKERIFSRLRLHKPSGPGVIHLPDWVSTEYLEQLTGEKKVPFRDKRTRTTRYRWVKTHDRNEALDLEVYGLAALWILQNVLRRHRDLAADAAALAAPPNSAPPAPPKPAPPRGGGGRQGGWVQGW